MSAMETLRLYVVTEQESGEDDCVALWDTSGAAAMRRAWELWQFDGEVDPSVLEAEEVAAPPEPPADDGPHEERRMAVWRALGMQFEGDDRCDCCGLAEMDEQWPLCCEDGRSCPDCGPCDACRERRSADASVVGA